jgi:signal transduction histidine kinase
VTDGEDRNDEDRRGSYLGFVAHEVRNPLSTALWSAELLGRIAPEERGGARGERLSAMCLRSIARVRQLVEDHLLCERLDVGGMPLRPEAVSPREVVEGILSKPGEHGEVSFDLDAGLAVEGDRALVERALDALVAAAGAEKAAVRVTARVEAGRIAITVVGHPPSADGLEDPQKGSPSDGRGRALAVPLARRIARALGGSLAATQTGYVLSLPRAAAYSARPKPAAPA